MNTMTTQPLNDVESASQHYDAAHLPAHGTDAAPQVIPPRNVEVPPPARADHSERQERVLASLLRMAETYQRTGGLRQAIELYLEIIRDYAETPQAAIAEDHMMKIGRRYEENGELRLARSIYEHLM